MVVERTRSLFRRGFPRSSTQRGGAPALSSALLSHGVSPKLPVVDEEDGDGADAVIVVTVTPYSIVTVGREDAFGTGYGRGAELCR